jgi:hypothetical protein
LISLKSSILFFCLTSLKNCPKTIARPYPDPVHSRFYNLNIKFKTKPSHVLLIRLLSIKCSHWI